MNLLKLKLCRASEVADFFWNSDGEKPVAFRKSKKVLNHSTLLCRILSSINFGLGRPLPLHFLRRNSKVRTVWGAESYCLKLINYCFLKGTEVTGFFKDLYYRYCLTDRKYSTLTLKIPELSTFCPSNNILSVHWYIRF